MSERNTRDEIHALAEKLTRAKLDQARALRNKTRPLSISETMSEAAWVRTGPETEERAKAASTVRDHAMGVVAVLAEGRASIGRVSTRTTGFLKRRETSWYRHWPICRQTELVFGSGDSKYEVDMGISLGPSEVVMREISLAGDGELIVHLPHTRRLSALIPEEDIPGLRATDEDLFPRSRNPERTGSAFAISPVEYTEHLNQLAASLLVGSQLAPISRGI